VGINHALYQLSYSPCPRASHSEERDFPPQKTPRRLYALSTKEPMRSALVVVACLSFILGAYLGRQDPSVSRVEVSRPLVVSGCGGAGVLNQSR
jgi:hypothetical protein